MLTRLQIRDFAIVEQLELELDAGLTVITGETGAGKSILVDAVNLLMGERADSNAIRHGAERAEIAACFDLHHLDEARAWLREHDLDATDECQLRRVIAAGRSRCYINGVLQPLAALGELGDLLVDIHGQHEHQSLLRRDAQRQLLDGFADNTRLLDELAVHYRHWQQLRRSLAALEHNDAERDARLDLLRYQSNELDALAPIADEPAALADEQRRLANAERLIDGSNRLLQALYENDEHALHGRLSRLETELDSLVRLDERLLPARQLLAEARIQIEEAAAALRDYGSDLDPDPNRLQQIEQRLDSYYTLARKHRCEPEQLATVLEQIRHQLDELDNSETRREQLREAVEQAEADYRTQAEQLSRRRVEAGARLDEQVSATMQELGMQGGRFRVGLNPLSEPASHGIDDIELLVSANPEQPVRPLSRVASGGELSRISLAIQVLTADSARIPTLIFDEVDTGIGGAVAEIVGRRLRQVAGSRQVLCVTHLAQVAAQAHHHLRVEKSRRKQRTDTTATRLDEEQRVTEIARMLGGVRLTPRSLAHAREMLDPSRVADLSP